MIIQPDILRYNRNPALSPWFEDQLNKLISFGVFHSEIQSLQTKLVTDLIDYKTQHNISNVVIGISGGLDSAVTALLFKEAGWNVIGVMLPIHQDEDELARAREFSKMLNVSIERDLTPLFDNTIIHMQRHQGFVDTTHRGLSENLVRQGNIRARLRMITLYDIASSQNGLVASTDNFSELATGFWTLHGDVGDVSPIRVGKFLH